MIKAAITGTGFMGSAHTEGLRRAGVEVIGILGSRPEKSSQSAKALGIPKAYASLEELLTDREVEVVHITTPNRHHFQSVQAAIAAGKHVLCEKPLAMNAKESAALLKLAQEGSVATGVNYNIRFYPLCQEAKERIAQGEAGSIHAINGAYLQDWLLHDTDYNWRVLDSEGDSLRAVSDIGTHWLDLVQTISGCLVTEVLADLHTIHPVRKRPVGEVRTFSGKTGDESALEPVSIATEDLGNILLRFDNGARGCLSVSQVMAGKKNCLRFDIGGSRQRLSWDSESPNELSVGHRSQPNQQLLKDPSLVSRGAASFVDYPGGHIEGYPDSFKMCFRAFYDFIKAGDFSAPASFATFEDGHREILLCDAILKSHQTQGWVAVPGS